MRKLTAFILLFVFLASQYARQAAWLECRISNYFSTRSIRCDCEKLLISDKTNTPPSPLPAYHNHLHIDEHFMTGNYTTGIVAPLHPVMNCSAVYSSALSPGTNRSIDHPPSG